MPVISTLLSGTDIERTMVFPVPVLALTNKSCFPRAAVDTFCPTALICIASSVSCTPSSPSTADRLGFPPANSGIMARTLFWTSLMAVSWNGRTVRAFRMSWSTLPFRLVNGVIWISGVDGSEGRSDPESCGGDETDNGSVLSERVVAEVVARGEAETSEEKKSSSSGFSAAADEAYHLAASSD
jgi:hypothetical protein